ncbi:MAG: GNAT family N-acetyltransferase [Bacteroidota bacterium]
MPAKPQMVHKWPINGWDRLLSASQVEGFRFLERMEAEWVSGKNRFTAHGERLLCITNTEGILAGIGGLNRDPFAPTGQVGRVRRMYIAPEFRRQGLASMLLESIVQEAVGRFTSLHLRTDQLIGAAFYEKHGFQRLQNHPSASHRLML